MLYNILFKQNSLWNETISCLRTSSGKQDSFHLGSECLVKEHIQVCPQRKEGTANLISTGLHVPSKRTCLNVFKADKLANGSVLRTCLPHHLPLGFHGNFKAA